MTSTDKPAEGELLSLLDNLDVIAWEADTSLARMRFVSAGGVRVLGYPREAWSEEGFFARHVHADDREATLALCGAVARDGTPRRVAFRMVASDGKARFFDTQVRRAEGGLIALMVDLSVRTAAGDGLAASAQTRLVLEQLPLIVWTTDRELRFSSGGGAALAKLGLAPNQLTGVPLTAYFKQVGDEENPSLVAATQALEGMTSKFDVTWGGRAYHAHVEPFRDASGAIVGSLGIATDVTERKELEAERDRLLIEASFLADASRILGHSLEHVRTLEEAMRRAVPLLADCVVVDVLAWDGTMQRFACTRDGTPDEDAVRALRESTPAAGVPERIARILQTGPSAILEPSTPLPEHMQRIAALGFDAFMWVPLTTRGRTLGALTFASRSRERTFALRDLALAEELAQRAAMAVDHARLYREARAAIALRDEFLSVAAHELRTPCTSLLLGVQSAQRLRRTKPEESSRPEYFERTLATAERQTRNLARLVDKLLDASRISGGRLVLEAERIDLSAMARAVLDDFREEAERDGSVMTLHASAPVMGRFDRLRVEQVLVNLVSNALKYGEGKPVDVTIRAESGTAIVEVRDHGIGVPRDKLPEIFERFGRAVSSIHYGGLGLGLYIVRRIVESHGGSVMCESSGVPGEGSLFRVTLPSGEA